MSETGRETDDTFCLKRPGHTVEVESLPRTFDGQHDYCPAYLLFMSRKECVPQMVRFLHKASGDLRPFTRGDNSADFRAMPKTLRFRVLFKENEVFKPFFHREFLRDPGQCELSASLCYRGYSTIWLRPLPMVLCCRVWAE